MKVYKKLWFEITSVIVALLLCLTAVFFIYVGDYYHATAKAVAVMANEKNVTVTQKNDMLIFSPTANPKNIGFVFYPGAKVEYTAYSPLMDKLAQKGITCVLVKMPYNLAIFDVKAADKAINAVPGIKNWYIGGHSLGGAMASTYAAGNAQKLEGIILLGAYSSSDLSKTDLKMLVLYGSNDKVLNRTELSKTKSNAPKNAMYYEISGGNHAGYGNYGVQSGDGTATISDDTQQNIVTDKILSVMESTGN